MYVLLYFLYSPKVIKLIGSSLGITEFEIIDHGVKLCVGLCVLTNNRITLQEFIRLQHILPSASNSTLTEKNLAHDQLTPTEFYVTQKPNLDNQYTNFVDVERKYTYR